MGTNPNWYKTSYRRNLVDMHIEDWDPSFMSRFSAETYYSQLVTAQVQSAMIYLQSHVGHCNWNTTSGHRHATFSHCEAEMKRLFDLCHGGGLDVIVYYSLIYNNDAYCEHPDWRLLDVDGHSTRLDSGEGQYFGGSRYGLCCPNNEGYRRFVLTQLDEIFDRFEFEGIFLDMTFWTRPCHCSACQARWRSEHGGELPRVVDWDDPDWQCFQRKREDWMQEFCQLVTDKIKSRNPNCSVEHQYSTMMHDWKQGVNRNIAMASDYCGGDFYGGVPQHSVACKLYYNMTRNQPFEYMTSRCYPGLREHTTTKTEDMLRQSVMSTLAHHGAVLLIDAIDPQGTLDSRIYEEYGKLYAEARLYEPFMEGKLCEDVAVFFNLEGKYNPVKGGTGLPHPEAVMGACRKLQQSHLPFGVFSDWQPEKMSGSRVIVLCDAYHLADDVRSFLVGYVSSGGRLYMSGRTDPRLVEALLGVRPQGSYDEEMVYMVPTAAGQSLFAHHTAEHPLALTGEVEVLPEGEYDGVLATVALPYARPEDPSDLHPDALDGYDYREKRARFASIHSNPPGRFLSSPALVWKRYGRGRVVYSVSPFESQERPANGPLFRSLIGFLCEGLGSWSFEIDGPIQLEAVCFRVPEKSCCRISLINCLEAFEIPPLVDVTVRVRVAGTGTSVLHLPSGESIPFHQSGDMVIFQVPRVSICEMYSIEWQ